MASSALAKSGSCGGLESPSRGAWERDRGDCKIGLKTEFSSPLGLFIPGGFVGLWASC